MANFDDIHNPNEGMLDISINFDQECHFNNKQDMLRAELTKLDYLPNGLNSPTRLISYVLNNLIDDPEESGTCHKNQFGKAGGAGFNRSYSKRC